MENTCFSCSAPTSSYSSKDLKCAPCKAGLDSESLRCLACGLFSGHFVRSRSEWIHLVCVALLRGQGSLTALPSSFEELSDDSFLAELTQGRCFVCRRQNELATVACKRCNRTLHISCLFLRKWKWNEGVICGCKIGPRKVKTVHLSETRAIACAELEKILMPIYKIDRLHFLSKDCPYRPDSLPEDWIDSYISVPPDKSLYIDNYQSQLIWVISTPKEPKKHLKISWTHSNMELLSHLIFENENRDEYIQDFAAHEDALITDLDFLLQTRVREMYYFSLNQFLRDFRVLCLFKLKEWDSEWAKRYINYVWEHGMESLVKSKARYKTALKKDWELCNSNHCSSIQVKVWNKEAFPSRSYTAINDYVEATGDEGVLQRLVTTKQGHCDGLNCDSLEGLGGLDLVNETWASSNSDRKSKTECSSLCKCDSSSCLNRAISLQKIQRLGEDVLEKETWGFDKYTYINLIFYSRQPVNDVDQNRFISKTLPRAINAVTHSNWDIRQSLALILNSVDYTLIDKRYAQGLMNAVTGLAETLGIDEALKAFRIHPKGTGVICNKPGGIKANELVIEYFGEVYSPARWYEKQDIIKKLNAKKAELPDFYNIMLERHADDPEGYDIVVVDPIVKGSYASRLSHSCNPNCGTVVSVANGKYTIGMYVLTDIEFGEELTFDYHSVTESMEEHSAAICLCASAMCRGHYLAFSKLNTFTKYLIENYTFLHRVAALLKVSGVETLSESDSELLSSFKFGSALLSGTPIWLQAWTAETLNFVRAEMSATSGEFERRNLKDSRVQNLAITIDKVKYALKRTARFSTPHAPLTCLTDEEVFNFYWGSDTSLKAQLILANSDCSLIAEVLKQPCENTFEAKLKLLEVRDLLRKEGPTDWRSQGVADILHLHAFTHIHFRSNPFSSFNVERIEIRYCDMYKSVPRDKSFSDLFDTGSKSYSSSYIEGSLVGWYKQTVENPAASLSAEKRGTLTLSSICQNVTETYTEDQRRVLLRHLRERPAAPWPSKVENQKMPWTGFSNSNRVHGSPMFDAVYFSKPHLLEECLDCIDSPFDQAALVLKRQFEMICQ